MHEARRVLDITTEFLFLVERMAILHKDLEGLKEAKGIKNEPVKTLVETMLGFVIGYTKPSKQAQAMVDIRDSKKQLECILSKACWVQPETSNQLRSEERVPPEDRTEEILNELYSLSRGQQKILQRIKPLCESSSVSDEPDPNETQEYRSLQSAEARAIEFLTHMTCSNYEASLLCSMLSSALRVIEPQGDYDEAQVKAVDSSTLVVFLR